MLSNPSQNTLSYIVLNTGSLNRPLINCKTWIVNFVIGTILSVLKRFGKVFISKEGLINIVNGVTIQGVHIKRATTGIS